MAFRMKAGRAVGAAIAKELLERAPPRFKVIYLITRFLFYHMAVQLTPFAWEKAKRPSSFDLLLSDF
ncbi:hypothetical protein [Paenibacillus soyae]|uniref:Uncharacterized protein n=1 Tax=Paenibacillus soyae TaxID=2969249 RepID=A0A9X2MQB9_9BACL|nr:hypothetical protein [Paenibacillus soyae]MCR2804909.1 hypothetical protein [Paenibacillus soyae]